MIKSAIECSGLDRADEVCMAWNSVMQNEKGVMRKIRYYLYGAITFCTDSEVKKELQFLVNINEIKDLE